MLPTLDQIMVAALAAACIVLAVKFELWHRNEQRRIQEYRGRLKDALARSPEDVAYAIERAEVEARMALVDTSSGSPLAHRLHEVAS